MYAATKDHDGWHVDYEGACGFYQRFPMRFGEHGEMASDFAYALNAAEESRARMADQQLAAIRQEQTP